MSSQKENELNLAKPDLKPSSTKLNDIKKISSEWGVDVNNSKEGL